MLCRHVESVFQGVYDVRFDFLFSHGGTKAERFFQKGLLMVLVILCFMSSSPKFNRYPSFIHSITLVLAPPWASSISMLRGLVFQAPAVKSGIAIGLEPLSTDHWLSGTIELQAAAS